MSMFTRRCGAVALLLSLGACITDADDDEALGERRVTAEHGQLTGTAIALPDGDVAVELAETATGVVVAIGSFDADAGTLEWEIEGDAPQSRDLGELTPTAEGTIALMYTEYLVATIDEDTSYLACELNCWFWNGDYGNCWCGCNPGGRSCSYGCCV